jgi:hypothetical protein
LLALQNSRILTKRFSAENLGLLRGKEPPGADAKKTREAEPQECRKPCVLTKA